jgi:hypothetical protein
VGPQTPAERQTESRYESAQAATGITFEEVNIEQMFRDANVDLSEPLVQQTISSYTGKIRAADTDQEKATKIAELQGLIPLFAQKYPAVPATPYSQALEASGFQGPLTQLGVTTPSELRGAGGAGIPPYQTVVGGRFAVQPDTGWMQYANGVLVDPSVPLGAAGGVYFQPGSTAPGSQAWLLNVQQSWGPERVKEWRKKLADLGYLSSAKGKGIDVTFINALRTYHEVRYQNGGTPVAADLAGGAGTDEYNLTAHDFQTQIRNDVREQWRSVFGHDPSDSELQDWTRFVTRSSLKAQRSLTKRGVPGATAGGLAATEAEEKLVEQLQTSPQAVVMQERYQENTALRDALQTAVATTRSLAG